jgi:hypothetical protein
MDLAFIKLAVQLLNAAYYRVQDLGRGEDILFTVKQEIKAGDVPRVKDLCMSLVPIDNNRLCRRTHNGNRATEANYRLLVWKHSVPASVRDGKPE